MIENPFYQNLDEYHADNTRISSTKLRTFAEDPGVYWDLYVNQNCDPDPPTPAMEWGQAIHAMVLEDEVGRSIVGVYPDHDPAISELRALTGPKRGALSESKKKKFAKMLNISVEKFMELKPGKQLNAVTSSIEQPLDSGNKINHKAAAEYRRNNPEYKIWMKRSNYRILRQCVNCFRQTEVSEILNLPGTMREFPLIWTDEETGLDCRCLIDFLKIDDEQRTAFIADLKISYEAKFFEKVMNQRNYHLQQQHYCSGVLHNYEGIIDRVEFMFVAHEPPSPFPRPSTRYATTLNVISEHDLYLAHGHYRAVMSDLAKALQKPPDVQWNHPSTESVNFCHIWKRTVSRE